jgi:hypothetical protein
MVNYTHDEFLSKGKAMMGLKRTLSASTERRKFRATFGTSPAICSLLWGMLLPGTTRGAKPVHLLWGLMLLKLYNSESAHCNIAGVDEKTFRKWSWFFIDAIAELSDDVVRSI